jgi:RimJ/RimL family protein N-acetyltransferase
MIKTERLLLRPATMDDLAEVHAFLSEESGSLYWVGPAHTLVAQTRDWLEAMIDGFAINGLDFLIEYQGRVIGKVGCFRPPEFGYRIHSGHWRKGIAREAVKASLIHVALTRPDIASLTADVDPRNAGSIRLLESLGFTERRFGARTIETHLGWCDSYYYCLPRDQMLALKPD